MIGNLPTSAPPCAANSRNPVDRSRLGVAAISWMIACGLFCGVAGGIGTVQAGADSGTVDNSPGRPDAAAQRGQQRLRGPSPRWLPPSRLPGRRPDRRRRKRRQVRARRPPRFPAPAGAAEREHPRRLRRSDLAVAVALAAVLVRRRGRHTPYERARHTGAADAGGGGGGGNGGGIAVTIPSPTVPGQPGEPTPVQVGGGGHQSPATGEPATVDMPPVIGLAPVEAPLRPVGTPGENGPAAETGAGGRPAPAAGAEPGPGAATGQRRKRHRSTRFV